MSQLSDGEREDLVAYLDGELDEKRARAVEARINVDERYRAEVHALKQAWELLDYLPRAEPSPTFTHRTLERLAVGGRRPTMPVARRRRWGWALGVGWAAAVLLVGALGYWVGGRLAPQPPPATVHQAEVDECLVQHRRVIEDQPLYELVDDLDTLEALAAPDLFGDESGS